MARRATAPWPWVMLAALVLPASIVLSAQIRPHDAPAAAAAQDPEIRPPDDTASGNRMTAGDGDYPKTWVANLFYETLVNFTVSQDVGNPVCRRQTQMYIEHLKNDSFWAVQSEYLLPIIILYIILL